MKQAGTRNRLRIAIPFVERSTATINSLASEQCATKSPRLINPFRRYPGNAIATGGASHSQADLLCAIFLERCTRRIHTILSHRSSRIFPVASLLHLSLASVAESERDRCIVHEKWRADSVLNARKKSKKKKKKKKNERMREEDERVRHSCADRLPGSSEFRDPQSRKPRE